MAFEASAKKGRRLHYVDLLESLGFAGERYVGLTNNLELRLHEHNAGKAAYTAPFKPWRTATYVAFSERGKAEAFERDLKSGSGHAFAKKRLW